jgi:hypothetical protein
LYALVVAEKVLACVAFASWPRDNEIRKGMASAAAQVAGSLHVERTVNYRFAVSGSVHQGLKRRIF